MIYLIVLFPIFLLKHILNVTLHANTGTLPDDATML